MRVRGEGGRNERGFVMKPYNSAADHIGLTNATLCMFTREFSGPFNGHYKVLAMLGGFWWDALPGVMDDFGNLVPVEG